MSSATWLSFATLIGLPGPLLQALPALQMGIDFARYRRSFK
jgi:hypothetical protein